MRNTIIAFFAIAVFVMSSCNKDSTPGAVTYAGGTLTYDSTVYNATTCAGSKSGASLFAGGLSASNFSEQFTMNFHFLNGFPDSSANYTVVNGHDTTNMLADQVAITGSLIGTNTATLYSTGGNGLQTIHVAVAGGLLTLTGTGITLSSAIDSAMLSVHLNQTQ